MMALNFVERVILLTMIVFSGTERQIYNNFLKAMEAKGISKDFFTRPSFEQVAKILESMEKEGLVVEASENCFALSTLGQTVLENSLKQHKKEIERKIVLLCKVKEP